MINELKLSSTGGLVLKGENCFFRRRTFPSAACPRRVPNVHTWDRTRSFVMKDLRHGAVHTPSHPRDKLLYPSFLCFIGPQYRYNRVKKIQLHAQIILSIFRQLLHVSAVSRPNIRRYNRMYTTVGTYCSF